MAGALLWSGAYGSKGQLYEVIPLPFSPRDINDLGQIVGVGNDSDSGFTIGWIYDDGQLSKLNVYPAHAGSGVAWISGIGISENGRHIVGQAAGVLTGVPGAALESRAVKFVDGVATDLGTLPGSVNFQGSQWAMALDVNDNGVVVGRSNDSAQTGRPVIFQNGQVIPIDAGSNPVGSANRIINDGTIFGAWGSGGGAVMYQGGQTIPLPPAEGDSWVRGAAVSPNGIAASASTGGPNQWDSRVFASWDTMVSPLVAQTHGAYPGATIHHVNGVNDSRVMVGNVLVDGTAWAGVVVRDGGILLLHDLIHPSNPNAGSVEITSAGGINNNGWIIASGKISGADVDMLLKPFDPGQSAEIVKGATPENLFVSIDREVGQTYRLKYTDDLNQGFDLQAAEMEGNGSPFEVSIDPTQSLFRAYIFEIIDTPSE